MTDVEWFLLKQPRAELEIDRIIWFTCKGTKINLGVRVRRKK